MSASLDVFTRKERGNLVGLGELGPHFKVRGLPFPGFGDSQESCRLLLPLALFQYCFSSRFRPSAAPELQVVEQKPGGHAVTVLASCPEQQEIFNLLLSHCGWE